jgi:hypothetical protein
MLIARPQGLFSNDYRITDVHGEPIAELAIAMIKEGGRLIQDGKAFRIERESLMSGPWQLKDGHTVLLEAQKVSMIKNRFEMAVKGASLELAPTNWLMRGFQVVGPDWSNLGTISRPSFFSRQVRIELSDLVPQQAQLFFLFLAIVVWRRAES